MKNRYVVQEEERKLWEKLDPGKTVFRIYDRQTQTSKVAYYMTKKVAEIRKFLLEKQNPLIPCV